MFKFGSIENLSKPVQVIIEQLVEHFGFMNQVFIFDYNGGIIEWF